MTSAMISFTKDEELLNTDESIDVFVRKLVDITKSHCFTKKLSMTEFSERDIFRVIGRHNELLCNELNHFLESGDSAREDVSVELLAIGSLLDVCRATLFLNAIRLGHNSPNLRLAWELSQHSISTKFLGEFLQSLMYIDRRIPEEGQSERLMLKYYHFLWQIRKYLKDFHNIDALQNLELFPINLDDEDKDYRAKVAHAVESITHLENGLRVSRYYVHSKIPFFVGRERYYEITLQLAGMYATKFNRLTVYTKENICTNYSIQIGYSEVDVQMCHRYIKNQSCNQLESFN